jgi:AcrR family transcriptional regulator
LKYRLTVGKYRPQVGKSIAGVVLRQAQRLEATRAAILEVATARFGASGYAATTMDQIAGATGVAKGAVYHHFPTKERLFEAVLRATTARLAADVARSAAAAADIWDAMSVATEAYFEACSIGPTAQIVLKDGPAVLGWERWREIDVEHFGQGMPIALETAMQQGLIARQPVEPLARLLLGAATEAAAAVAASADPTATGRAHADAFRALLEGLRRRP